MHTAPPTFDDVVSHERFDLAEYEECYVIGDVHGCIDRLEALVEEIDPTRNDLLVFVGDLVRKGPDSSAVVEWVRSHPTAETVLGNNEAKILEGEATLPELDAEQEVWLRNRPDVISFGDAIVAHGGLDPRAGIERQDPETLRTVRSIPAGSGYDGPFWFEQYDGPYRVYFGHTVLATPFRDRWAVGLDTGCVYGGRLSAMRHGDGTVISVAGQYEEWQRPSDQIVSHAPERA